MKKLFKLVSLAALVAGVTWILRDQLLPGPQQPTAHPPPFRNPPPPSEAQEEAASTTPSEEGFKLQDDLTAVNGIGPVYAKKLSAAGIKSFGDLANADPKDLANRTDLAQDRVADWIRKASDLA